MPSSLELYRYKCLIGNKIFRGYSSLTLLQLNRRVLPGVGEMPIHNNFSFTFAKVTAVNWKELPQVKWRFRHYWLICWESASTVFPYKNSLSFSEFIFFFLLYFLHFPVLKNLVYWSNVPNEFPLILSRRLFYFMLQIQINNDVWIKGIQPRKFLGIGPSFFCNLFWDLYLLHLILWFDFSFGSFRCSSSLVFSEIRDYFS